MLSLTHIKPHMYKLYEMWMGDSLEKQRELPGERGEGRGA